MSTTLSYDPILSLVVSVLSRIEERTVDYKDLKMAAIVRNGYYIGLSYKSDDTFVIWRSGSDTVEFYDRKTWNLLDSVHVSDPKHTDADSSVDSVSSVVHVA
ncbi:MAG: hypothetical protein Q4D38_07645 [Planctomycetia bacterium]|nr:hypothetical protein [Planctomycetia bacterium]